MGMEMKKEIVNTQTSLILTPFPALAQKFDSRQRSEEDVTQMQGFALEKPMQRSSLLELKAKAEMQKMAIKDLLQGDREVLDSEEKYPCEMKEFKKRGGYLYAIIFLWKKYSTNFQIPLKGQ